jgi:hypothetical protein
MAKKNYPYKYPTKEDKPVLSTFGAQKILTYSKTKWTNKPLGAREDGFVLWTITSSVDGEIIETWKRQ